MVWSVREERVDDYMAKSFRLSELVSRIDMMLPSADEPEP